MLRGAGAEDRFEEVNRRAVEAAMAARDAVGRPDTAVAGSISLGVAVDSCCAPRSPRRARPADAFSEQAETLAGAGVDLLALEMMMSPIYGVPAVEAALETGLPVWLGVSAGLSPDSELQPLDAEGGSFDGLLDALLRPELAAVTVMHSSSRRPRRRSGP